MTASVWAALTFLAARETFIQYLVSPSQFGSSATTHEVNALARTAVPKSPTPGIKN